MVVVYNKASNNKEISKHNRNGYSNGINNGRIGNDRRQQEHNKPAKKKSRRGLLYVGMALLIALYVFGMQKSVRTLKNTTTPSSSSILDEFISNPKDTTIGATDLLDLAASTLLGEEGGDPEEKNDWNNLPQKKIYHWNNNNNNLLHNNNNNSINNKEETTAMLSSLHNGRVVQELCGRVLSRSIAQANILVVSSDAEPSVSFSSTEQQQQQQYGPLSRTVVSSSIQEGHDTYVVSPHTALSHWWSSTGNDNTNGNDGIASNTPFRGGSNWILLAYFIAATNNNEPDIDTVLHPSNAKQFLEQSTITYMVYPVHSQLQLIQDNNTTANGRNSNNFRLSGVIATQTLLDADYKIQVLATSHYITGTSGNMRSYGPNSLLKSSGDIHRFLTSGAMTAAVSAGAADAVAGGSASSFHALLFATQGLDLAIPSRLSYLNIAQKPSCALTIAQSGRCDSKLSATISDKNEDRILQECPIQHKQIMIVFKGPKLKQADQMYLSQARDLPHLHHNPYYKEGTLSPIDEEVEIKINQLRVKSTHPEIFELWFGHPDPKLAEAVCVRTSRNSLVGDKVACTTRILPKTEKQRIRQWQQQQQQQEEKRRKLREKEEGDPQKRQQQPDKLNSSREDQSLLRKDQPTEKNRRLQEKPELEKGKYEELYNKHDKFNLLLIMIDPLSQQQFVRSLPKTMKYLHKMGFINFSHDHHHDASSAEAPSASYYTVVGDNSGPNQAALYTGYPLEGGRNGIKNSKSHAQKKTEWIWDTLQQQSYATLKGEDICISNSNMVQSMEPKTNHGQQLYDMFCFDFDRPNCLGKNMTSEFLLEYAKQFIDAYTPSLASSNSLPATAAEARKKKEDQQKIQYFSPWAAFLSFIDSHEDTLTLVRYLDDRLLTFFQDLKKKPEVLDKTLIVFLSDHGLHYGPSFRSPSGIRERAQPFLQIHLPKLLRKKSQLARENLEGNARGNFYITPYDVHETILHVLLSMNSNNITDVDYNNNDNNNDNSNNKKKLDTKLGFSLIRPLPKTRKTCEKTPGVPTKYCEQVSDYNNNYNDNNNENKNIDMTSQGGGKAEEDQSTTEENKEEGSLTGEGGTCTFMPQPPSIYSFYADIPKENKPRWPDCSSNTTISTSTSTISGSYFSSQSKAFLVPNNNNNEYQDETYCYCATNIRDWFPCGGSDGQSSLVYGDDNNDEIHLTMKTCGYHDLDSFMELNITVPRKESVVHRYREKQQQQQQSTASNAGNDQDNKLPNILFIEVDSVSVGSADRHFPKLQELLHRHRVQHDISSSSTTVTSKNKKKDKLRRKTHHHYSCPTGFCSFVFNKTSVVGQNSIPNQLASLSGCIDRNISNSDLYLHKAKDSNGYIGDTGIYGPTFDTWCVGDNNKNNDEDDATATKSPWLFDIVQDLGYVTFFGEEFCYGDSPYVVQNQAFPLNADITIDTVFCRLASNMKRKIGTTIREPLFAVDHDSSKKPNPCVDGRSRQQFAFEYIQGIWDAYPDVPKFAFLNSLAAHDYSVDTAYLPLGQDVYDDLLSGFLTDLLSSSSDMENTIIVLRSDHGVQGGPAPIDYSAQIEHMNPWNNLIIPEKVLLNYYSKQDEYLLGKEQQQQMPVVSLLSRNLEALVSNQYKLVTGFDLYHTLRDVLRTTPAGGNTGSERKRRIPGWSYNLITQHVPESRSCSDARIPNEFCPCVEERTDLMPYFYVGHAEKISKLSAIKSDRDNNNNNNNKAGTNNNNNKVGGTNNNKLLVPPRSAPTVKKLMDKNNNKGVPQIVKNVLPPRGEKMIVHPSLLNKAKASAVKNANRDDIGFTYKDKPYITQYQNVDADHIKEMLKKKKKILKKKKPIVLKD